ncbi:MAG: hypothetical protein QOE70_334 [Chthoniobacter sp.]|jgi:hypothetical protein|nr:hypothetical protein [Chthoniobacter sp.]
MKARPCRARHLCGLALIELLVATAVMMIVGGLVFYTFNAGLVLFAKNTSVNVAHQQARVAVLNMEQDLHAAISIPQLTDANRNAIVGSGPAPGISFQMFAAGPFQVVSTAAAGQNQITVRVSGYTPKIGQRLCLPLHQIELDVTGVGAGLTDRILTLASNLPRPVETTLDNAGTSVPVVVLCFLSDRNTFVVNNGELRYFKPGGDPAGRMMANDITSTDPFSIPVTPLGAPYNRFVAAINLSTADHSTSNRRFKAANMFLNAMVPYRAKLCYYQ